MIDPGFEILNQRGTPMFFSDVFANRPTAGVVGRIFISTDTYAFYRDTGTTWDLIGGPGTGTITGSISPGQVAYGTAANTIGGNNDLYWYNPVGVQSTLCIGTTSTQSVPANTFNLFTAYRSSPSQTTFISVANGSTNTGNSKASIFFQNAYTIGPIYANSAISGVHTDSSGNTALLFETSTTGTMSEKMRLFSTGNLGIGVGSTDGGQRLQVSGTSLFTGASTFNSTITASSFIKSGGLSTQYLMADGSTSTLTNPVTGTGASGQVAYWSGTNTQTGSNNLFWDAANSRLGIGTNTPSAIFHARISASAELIFKNTSQDNLYLSGTNATINIDSTGGGTFPGIFLKIAGTNYGQFTSNTGSTELVSFQNTPILFKNSSTERMRIIPVTGNVHIGTFTSDSGQRLQVTGDGYFSGSVGIGSTSLTSYNLRVTKNITGATIGYGITSDGVIQSDVTSSGLFFSTLANTQNATFTLNNLFHFSARQGTFGASSTITKQVGFFVESSVVGAGTNIGFEGNIASGTGRWNIYMSGTAANYLAGNLWIGTTSGNHPLEVATASNTILYIRAGATSLSRLVFGTSTNTDRGFIDYDNTAASRNMSFKIAETERMRLDALGNLLLGSATAFTANERLQVTGTQQNKHTITYSTGAVQSFRIQKDLTIGSGATISSASTLSNAIFTGDNIFGGNVTIPESSPFANVYGANYYQFNAAGITITQTQATGGKRTLTQYYAQNYFKGSNSGTITDMSSIQIAGWYNNNTGSITPIITNAYQLLIADIGEYGHTFTLTNRWGIYQDGASDRNYMAGKLMLNTTTDTGERLQLNGSIRIDGQTSGTAGGSSGQHLIINCDGTTYKIALLNN